MIVEAEEIFKLTGIPNLSARFLRLSSSSGSTTSSAARFRPEAALASADGAAVSFVPNRSARAFSCYKKRHKGMIS